MKAGAVVSIRVNTMDLMSVIDMVHKAGAFSPGMSLSSAVSLGLSIATEELRRQGKLPTRDGFEYASMVEPFAASKRNNKVKRAFADAKYMNDAEGFVPALPSTLTANTVGLTDEEIIQRQMEELDRAGL